MSALKLGRLPNQGRPRIRLTADLIPAAVFTPPPAVDYYSHVPASSWGMDGNDAVGDCTCAEVDHTTKARQVAAGNPEVASTKAEVLAAYSAITGWNPKNPASDQGAEMQAVREYWLNVGVTLGGKPNKILLFAQVDHTRLDLIRWCVDRFGAVGLGINLPSSAMDQFNAGKPWTVVRGAQIEGGHAISLVGYDPQYAYVVTWGQVQKMDWAFFVAYVEEAWTDVSTDWINAVTGLDALGEVAFALGEQFRQVTGQPNPFPLQPAPSPTPQPGPSSSLPADCVSWAQRTISQPWHSRRDKQAAKELLDWAKA